MGGGYFFILRGHKKIGTENWIVLKHSLLLALASLLLFTACKKDDGGDSGGCSGCACYDTVFKYTETAPMFTTAGQFTYSTTITNNGFDFSMVQNVTASPGTYTYEIANDSSEIVGDFTLDFDLDELTQVGLSDVELIINFTEVAPGTAEYEASLKRTSSGLAYSYGDPNGTPTTGNFAITVDPTLGASLRFSRTGNAVSITLSTNLTTPINDVSTVIGTGENLLLTITAIGNTVAGSQTTSAVISDFRLQDPDGDYPEYPFSCTSKIFEAP